MHWKITFFITDNSGSSLSAWSMSTAGVSTFTRWTHIWNWWNLSSVSRPWTPFSTIINWPAMPSKVMISTTRQCCCDWLPLIIILRMRSSNGLTISPVETSSQAYTSSSCKSSVSMQPLDPSSWRIFRRSSAAGWERTKPLLTPSIINISKRFILRKLHLSTSPALKFITKNFQANPKIPNIL